MLTRSAGALMAALVVALSPVMPDRGEAADFTPGLRLPVAVDAGQEGDLDPLADRAAELARNGVADELGISADSVAVVDVTPVEWPDASLGCPRPDLMYAQVITPGYSVLLEVDGRLYSYRTAGATRGLLCGESVGATIVSADPSTGTVVVESQRDGTLTQVQVSPATRILCSDGSRADFTALRPEAKTISVGPFDEAGVLIAREITVLC